MFLLKLQNIKTMNCKKYIGRKSINFLCIPNWGNNIAFVFKFVT